MGFDINIDQDTKSTLRTNDEWRIRLYEHADYHSNEDKGIPFRRELDYYSLGVEIGKAERLPFANGLGRREVINLSPLALKQYLVEATVGNGYSEVVVRCLTDDFGNGQPDVVGLLFNVCDVLDDLWTALS
jgi:hypothetical protein